MKKFQITQESIQKDKKEIVTMLSKFNGKFFLEHGTGAENLHISDRLIQKLKNPNPEYKQKCGEIKKIQLISPIPKKNKKGLNYLKEAVAIINLENCIDINLNPGSELAIDNEGFYLIQKYEDGTHYAFAYIVTDSKEACTEETPAQELVDEISQIIRQARKYTKE